MIERDNLSLAELRRIENYRNRYMKMAKEVFENKVRYYINLTGGEYKRISVRDQKTRWGSCSSNGTLSFNYRLLFAPVKCLDYVVVHELCHLTHMNHSKEFWNKVAEVMPDYKEPRRWLKDHGNELSVEAHLKKQGISLKI